MLPRGTLVLLDNSKELSVIALDNSKGHLQTEQHSDI